MTLSPLIVAALFMGLFGSPHCLGMCGGLVTAFGLSMQEVSPLKKRGLIATYHFSRLLSYAFLGLIAGLIGTTALAPLMDGNNVPRLLLGLVLVLIGLSMLGWASFNKLEKFGMAMWQKLSPLRQKVFPINTFPKAFFAGLLWGFLPCGLVYSALLMAAVSPNIATSALLMFAFGLGTVPMLVATQETVGWLQRQIGRFRLRQLNGVIMILSGLAVMALPLIMQNLHGNHQGHQSHQPSHSQAHGHEHADATTGEHANSNEHIKHDASMTHSESMHHDEPMN